MSRWQDWTLEKLAQRIRTLIMAGQGARVYRGSNQSIDDSINTAVCFTGVRWDTGGHWSGANPTRLTCVYPGTYVIIAALGFVANGTGFRQGSLRVNNTTWIGTMAVPAVSTRLGTQFVVASLYALAAGDYLEAYVYQTSGGALDLFYNPQATPELMMARIA